VEPLGEQPNRDAGAAGSAASGWVAPEAGLDLPTRAVPSSPAAVAGPTAPVAVAPVRLPVPLQPLTISDILDGSWSVVKARPRTVLGLAALVMVPVQVLSSYLLRGYDAAADLTSLFSNTGGAVLSETSGRYDIVVPFVAASLLSLATMLLGAALARLVSAWYAGGDPGFGETVRAVARRGHVLLAAWMLTAPVKIAALAVCLGLPLVAAVPVSFLLLTAPIIAVEGAGPVAAPLRSMRLVRRRFWPVLWVVVLAYLVEQTVVLSFSLLGDIVALLTPDEWDWLVTSVGGSVARVVAAPAVVAVAVIVYLDLRVRAEGLDLELEVARHESARRAV
jgi:hypothetical protein